MALTLNNLNGFETGGLEEAESTAGTPSVQSTTKRTGDYALELATSGDYYIWNIIGAGSDAGQKRIVSFHVRFSSLTTAMSFFLVHEAASLVTTTCAFRLLLETDGDLVFTPNSGATTTVTNPFTVDTWHRIDILWEEAASGTFDLWLDGSSIISLTGQDLLSTNPQTRYRFNNNVASQTVRFDDCASLTGATSTTEFLGDIEVFRYQNQLASVTPDSGSNLDGGFWSYVGETPMSEGLEALYSASNVGGHAFTDDTASGLKGRHGPHGDTNIDGTIKGALWIWRLQRGTGAGTTHSVRYGNDVDTITEDTQALTGAYVNYFRISEAATIVPTASEHFAQGFKTGGAQNILCAEMWAMILHVPAAGSVTVTPPTLALTTSAFAPVVKLAVIPGVVALSLSTFIPPVTLGTIVTPPVVALTTATFVPTITATQHQLITPPLIALTTSLFAPVIKLAVIPGLLAHTISLFAPTVTLGTIITPPTLALITGTFIPIIKLNIIPSTLALTTNLFIPILRLGIIPGTIALTTATFIPAIGQGVVPGVVALTTATFIPIIKLAVIPGLLALTTSMFAPSIGVGIVVTVPIASLTTSTFIPLVNLSIIPPLVALTMSLFAPTIVVGITVTVPVLSLTTATFIPVVSLGIIPNTIALTTNLFIPIVSLGIIPNVLSLTTATFIPVLRLGIIPTTLSLLLSSFIPTAEASVSSGLAFTGFRHRVSIIRRPI